LRFNGSKRRCGLSEIIIGAELEPFEIGALLLATLAFPGVGEEGARASAAKAWCAETLRLTREHDPQVGKAWLEQFPQYAGLDKKTISRRVRQTGRRFRDRMVAARMARGFFQEAITGQDAVLPSTMARLSLNELCRLVLHESGQSEPENVEKRIWRRSRRVTHLAMAIDVIHQHARPGERDVGYDTQDMELHRRVVAVARTHEDVVLADRRFSRKPIDLLKLRWGP